MSTIVTRSGKGSPLTHDEVDANFVNLNTDKIQSGNTVAALTITNATINGGVITGITDLAVADGGTGASDASTARTNLGVTATGSDSTYAYRANNLSDLTSASTARTNLGLGTLATQAANNVAITGGSITGTPIGATTPSTGEFTNINVSSINGGQIAGIRNRIINGAMMIDQRNSGSAITITNGNTGYGADRWQQYVTGGTLTVQRTGAAGSYALQLTGATGINYAEISQKIEAANIADCASQTVTLSFTISSSTLTTVSIYYSTPTAVDNWTTRNTNVLIGSPTISATPTNFSYSVTLPASTINGLVIYFATGAFTSGTLIVKNIQLEKGSTATPFEFRPYVTELALCQRYYYKATVDAGYRSFGGGGIASTYTATAGNAYGNFPVTMRIRPTALEQSGAATDYICEAGGVQRTCSAVPTYNIVTSPNGWSVNTTVASGQTAYQASSFYSATANAYLGWSAEL